MKTIKYYCPELNDNQIKMIWRELMKQWPELPTAPENVNTDSFKWGEFVGESKVHSDTVRTILDFLDLGEKA